MEYIQVAIPHSNNTSMLASGMFYATMCQLLLLAPFDLSIETRNLALID
jgi:hypothetical protein